MISEIPLGHAGHYKVGCDFGINGKRPRIGRRVAARYSHSFPVEGSAISAPDFPTFDCATGR